MNKPDVSYFEHKLKLVLRDIDNNTCWNYTEGQQWVTTQPKKFLIFMKRRCVYET